MQKWKKSVKMKPNRVKRTGKFLLQNINSCQHFKNDKRLNIWKQFWITRFLEHILRQG